LTNLMEQYSKHVAYHTNAGELSVGDALIVIISLVTSLKALF